MYALTAAEKLTCAIILYTQGDPDIQSSWNERFILDDPVKASNLRGTLSFALAGPDTRTTQLFFNLVDNSRLDALNFAPFATVIE